MLLHTFLKKLFRAACLLLRPIPVSKIGTQGNLKWTRVGDPSVRLSNLFCYSRATFGLTNPSRLWASGEARNGTRWACRFTLRPAVFLEFLFCCLASLLVLMHCVGEGRFEAHVFTK